MCIRRGGKRILVANIARNWIPTRFNNYLLSRLSTIEMMEWRWTFFFSWSMRERMGDKLIKHKRNKMCILDETAINLQPPLVVFTFQPTLGVSSISKALLYVILSPCGMYFESGAKPIRLYADGSFVRAWPGGCGDVKMGANYAPTVFVQVRPRPTNWNTYV